MICQQLVAKDCKLHVQGFLRVWFWRFFGVFFQLVGGRGFFCGFVWLGVFNRTIQKKTGTAMLALPLKTGHGSPTNSLFEKSEVSEKTSQINGISLHSPLSTGLAFQTGRIILLWERHQFIWKSQMAALHFVLRTFFKTFKIICQILGQDSVTSYRQGGMIRAQPLKR